MTDNSVLEALDQALEQFGEPMSMLNSHELGERLASDVAEIVRHARARQALAHAAVGEGYAVVPVEPTEAMCQKGLEAGARYGVKAMANIWSLMLQAASPLQSAGER